MRERGLKYTTKLYPLTTPPVAPVRERGLKFSEAVIELEGMYVAPVRERGLKYTKLKKAAEIDPGRSREGAWIEITRLCMKCVTL